jgi:hypothetical protein
MERKRYKYDMRRALSSFALDLLSIVASLPVLIFFERIATSVEKFCQQIDGGILGICLGPGASVAIALVISWMICRYWWNTTVAKIYFWSIQWGIIGSLLSGMEIRHLLIFLLPQNAVSAYFSWRNKRSVRDRVFSASGQATDDAAAASGLGAIDADSTSF